MKVLLADDHQLIRSGLRALLASMPGIQVVAETGDGPETLRLATELKPDVVLLDITMPGLNGLEVTKRLRAVQPKAKVLILSMHAGESYVLQALRAGASGYLLKESAVSDPSAALDSVAKGGLFLSASLSRRVVEDFIHGDHPRTTPLDRLSPRQREVLQLIAESRSTKEIAADLGLSVKTVETHRSQIMERLGIHDVPGLVRFAIREGIVSPDL